MASSSKKLVLYGYILCPYVQRVRLALEALKIDYDYANIDLVANAQRDQSYLKVNPFGKVPTIKTNDQIIFESLVLLEFVSDRFGNVLPKDDVQKAHSRIWANYFDQNVINKFYPLYTLIKANNQDAIKNHTNQILENIQFFTKHSGLEKSIKQNEKSYFLGDKLSYVDFAITPHIRFIETFYRLFLNQNIYSSNAQAEIFQVYAKNVTQSQPYLDITDKLKEIPSSETDSLFRDLRIDSIQKFNYEHIFKEYYKKKLEQ